jgi:hypothetical protein
LSDQSPINAAISALVLPKARRPLADSAVDWSSVAQRFSFDFGPTHRSGNAGRLSQLLCGTLYVDSL